jgi:hypothetical protein
VLEEQQTSKTPIKMKTRLFFAALLLLAFGTVKAQDTVTASPKQQDPAIIMRNMPDMSRLPELMRELGVNLQMLTDSVDWQSFEKDMEKWGEEMEEWGRKMEQWGAEFEKKYDMPDNYRPTKKDDSPIRVIRVTGSGDVDISQTPGHFSLKKEGEIVSDFRAESEMLLLSSSHDYEVEVSQLENIQLLSSGDVICRNTIKGDYINVYNGGSGDMVMKLDYDTVHVVLNGSGDIILQGRCNVLETILLGSGDLNVDGLNVVKSNVVDNTSSKEGKFKGSRSRKKDLLFDAHWNGFEAGLNMLFSTPADVVNTNNGAQGMEIRPLRSWYFGFNIADVGVAFDRRHRVGLFTGVGLGWNNFSWNNNIKIEYNPDNVVYTLVPIETDQIVKNSKYGALFLQMPLMLEVRPTRSMYIDAGVTGGLRIAQWNRVKLEDGTQSKRYYGASINQFKLDASLRVGGDGIGFFANYALLPIFEMSNAKVHPVSFGFSINF